MSTTSLDPYAPPSHDTRQPELRIAIVLEDERGREALVATLAAGGLPVNAGALTLHRLGELAHHPPDAVVLVVDLARGPGLAALRRMRKELPATRIVVVAGDAGAGAARQTLNAGADALVPLPEIERSLAPVVGAVMAGFVCTPRWARRLVAKPSFSHREKEVLALLVAGLTNREIAGRLYLAESTVKSHLASAFAKLGVRSRKDAAALLLDPAEGLAATALPPEAALPSILLTS
ncbi:MAG: response regulator transcription factor [Solirubrobacterales bacterium]|jgi:DNA-binding NarL/FixJ family response regulator|nr:response regulator transcription factor [Solirubrobacterales bacterium]